MPKARAQRRVRRIPLTRSNNKIDPLAGLFYYSGKASKLLCSRGESKGGALDFQQKIGASRGRENAERRRGIICDRFPLPAHKLPSLGKSSPACKNPLQLADSVDLEIELLKNKPLKNRRPENEPDPAPRPVPQGQGRPEGFEGRQAQ